MDGRATEEGQGPRLSAPASLTLYAALCMLAVVASFVALVGLAGTYPATSDALLDVLRQLGAGSLAGTLEGPVEDIATDRQLALALLVAGIAATALLSSLYLHALRPASRPDRGPPHVIARVVVAQLVALIGLCVIATGPAADAIANVSGISGDATTAWDIGKWPVLLVLTCIAFATIQRAAFTEPDVLPSSAVSTGHVLALLVWLLAITGFVLYLASFGHVQETYGTLGAAAVLLVWLTMFSVLSYMTPDLRATRIGPLGAGAAPPAFTWLAVWGALAVCVASLDSIDQTYVAIAAGIVFVAGLWVTNVALLFSLRLSVRRIARTHASVMTSPDIGELVLIVSRALQNDAAHDSMLRPVTGDEAGPTRLSDLELDLADWGFTYGVAWAVARARYPHEPDASVAKRALAAAQDVFRMYCGTGDWAERIRGYSQEAPAPEASASGERARAGSPNGQHPAPARAGEAS